LIFINNFINKFVYVNNIVYIWTINKLKTNKKMTNVNFKIGQKVNYVTGKFMINGIVTGIDKAKNRVFVNWPEHGPSSINADDLI